MGKRHKTYRGPFSEAQGPLDALFKSHISWWEVHQTTETQRRTSKRSKTTKDRHYKEKITRKRNTLPKGEAERKGCKITTERQTTLKLFNLGVLKVRGAVDGPGVRWFGAPSCPQDSTGTGSPLFSPSDMDLAIPGAPAWHQGSAGPRGWRGAHAPSTLHLTIWRYTQLFCRPPPPCLHLQDWVQSRTSPRSSQRRTSLRSRSLTRTHCPLMCCSRRKSLMLNKKNHKYLNMF